MADNYNITDDQASITEEILVSAKRGNQRNSNSNRSIMRNKKRDISDDDASSTGNAIPEEKPEVLLQGWMLKQNRSNYWQDRYFVFQSDQTLTYQRNKDDDASRTVYRISRETGCDISDVYVEQTRGVHHSQHQAKENAGGKQLLYCITISFPDDTTDTVATTAKFANNDSFRDDGSLIGEHISPEWSGSRPSSPNSPQRQSKQNKKVLATRHSDLGQRNSSLNDESSIDSVGLSLPGTESRKKKGLSFLLRRHKRQHSTTDLPPRSNGYFADESLAHDNVPTTSFTTPTATPRRRANDIPVNGVAAMDLSVTNLKFADYSATSPGRKKRLARSDVTGVPLNDAEGLRGRGDSIGIMDLPAAPLIEVSGSQELGDDDDIPKNHSFNLSQTERMRNLSRILSEEYGVDEKPSVDEQILLEQEKLRHQFLYKQRKKRSATMKRVVAMTKIGVVAATTIGVGVITAGAGLAAGLAFLGVSAVLGGTAGAAEVGLKSAFKKKDHLTIATTNYELAKWWKHTLDACLEQESFKHSTWGQLFVAEGRKTTNALITNVYSADEDDPLVTGTLRGSPKVRSKGEANLFLRDPNFLAHVQARWRPLEGGWVSFLGPGAQCLRVFKEERIQTDEKPHKVSPLAVVGSTCTPLRTQIVLNAHPFEAFMCVMSYARIHSLDNGETLSPNSGQNASYRLIEKCDIHTDVIHLFCRELYLFPSWTEARDFVLLRYWRLEPDGSYVICYESVEHPLCPPQPGFVRGEMHQVYTIAPPKIKDYRAKEPNRNECMLTSVVQVDPKGWVPTIPMSFLSNQTYADAFGISALMQTLDIRDAIENDRFLDLSPGLHHPTPSFGKETHGVSHSQDYDLRYVNRERCDSFTSVRFPSIGSHPEPLANEKWAEPDANSFMVRGPSYKTDRVKVNAGDSIGQLIAVDVVEVEKPIYSGMSTHPSERIQLGLAREKILKEKGIQSDMPPFIFVVNIILPGPPFYHGVFYYAVDDISTVNGSDGTPSSKLCQRFFFGGSDDFRDRTFKLIPRIVEGNFMVRKAVGNTPAIMGTKLKQRYVRNERFMEVILDCGSSAVATGVIRVSLGYAKTLVVDMGFLLEADDEDYLPEKIFGAVRMKYPSFGSHLRKVEVPSGVSY
jgi:Protein ENHANCED DISEASE RESISTANCE 2, C-terminal/START domain